MLTRILRIISIDGPGEDYGPVKEGEKIEPWSLEKSEECDIAEIKSVKKPSH